MKNIALLDQLKCIVKNDCHSIDDYNVDAQEEAAQTESAGQHFQPFDIDEVFAN
jgi:hypothetical protein